MKKRNMLTKVAALSMAALMTVTGLPVAGLDGALSVEAKSFSDRAADDALALYVNEQNSADDLSLTVGKAVNLNLTTGNTVVSASKYEVDKNDVTAKVVTSGVATDTAKSDYSYNESVTSTGTAGLIPIVATSDIVVSGHYAGNEAASAGVVIKSPSISKANVYDSGTEFKFAVVSGAKGGTSGVTAGYITLTGDGDGLSVDADASLLKVPYLNVNYIFALKSAKIATDIVDGGIDVTKYVNSGSFKANSKDISGVEIKNAGTYSIDYALSNSPTFKDTSIGFDFEIEKLDVAEATVKADNAQFTGGSIKADVSVTYTVKNAENDPTTVGEDMVDTVFTLVKDTDFSVTYDSNVNVGTASVEITGIGNCTGSNTSATFRIDKADLKALETAGTIAVDAIPNQALSNGEATPKPVVYWSATWTTKDEDYDASLDFVDASGNHHKILVEGEDYNYSYANNKEAGTGIVYINAEDDGNFINAFSKPFTIKKSSYDLNSIITSVKVYKTNGKTEIEEAGDVEFDKSADSADDYIGKIEIKYVDPDDDKEKSATLGEAGFSAGYEAINKIGTAKITLENTGKFGGTYTRTITVVAKDLGSNDVKINAGKALSTTAWTYNGTALSLADGKVDMDSIIKDSTNALEPENDFTIDYDNNINAGKATATFVGKGNYTGTATIDFTINAVSLTASNNGVKYGSIPNQAYTGEALTPDMAVEFVDGNGITQTLVNGVDYTLDYGKEGANVGSSTKVTSVTVAVKGIGNFKNTKTSAAKFNIVVPENDLAKATIELTNNNIPYDGKYHSAAVKSVMLDGVDVKEYVTLVKTVSVSEAGTYDVQIKADTSKTNNKYGGVGTTTFTITPKEVNNATLTLDGTTSFTYDGKTKTVKVASVTLDGETVAPEDGYTVSGLSATAAGTKTAKATFKGNYSGTATAKWTIKKAANPIKVSPTSKSYKVSAVKKAKKTFTIKATKAQGKVTYKSNSKKVTVSSKGKVTVKKGTKKGTYKITVKAAGNTNYNAASKTVTIKVK